MLKPPQPEQERHWRTSSLYREHGRSSSPGLVAGLSHPARHPAPTIPGEDYRCAGAKNAFMETAIVPTDAPRKAPAESVNRAWLRALELAARIERAPERILA